MELMEEVIRINTITVYAQIIILIEIVIIGFLIILNLIKKLFK